MSFLKVTCILQFMCLLISCNKAKKDTEESLTKETIDTLLAKDNFKASNGLELPYRIFKPKNTNAKQPLIVFLHGRGDRGTENGTRTYHEFGWVTQQNSILSVKMQDKYPCYILIPQCSDKTKNEEWAKWIGNTPETPFEGLSKNGTCKMHPQPSESGAATLELIETTISTYAIDKNRVYLIGLSMGGFGTWEFIARRPNLFAAAIPMAGYSDPDQVKRIKDIPLWIFHGSHDQWNPVEGSRHMYKLLLNQKADVTYTEYESTGHTDAFKKAFNEPNLLLWLFSKSKENSK